EMRVRLQRDYSLLPGHRWFLPAHWLLGLNEVLAEEERITVLTGARCSEVLVDESGRVCGGVASCGGYTVTVKAKVSIDATGTGFFSEAAGCQTMYGRDARATFNESLAPEEADDQVQQVTQMYVSQRMPGASGFDMTQLEHVRLGVLVSEVGWFHQHKEKAMEKDLGIHLHWGCAVKCRDTRDPVAIADAQREALVKLKGDLELLRQNRYAVHLAPKLGVREVRRVVGEYVIAQDHLVAGAYPEDTIAICGYGLDIWGENTGAVHSKKYGIPLRALIPKGVSGLLVTGKCASGSHIAMSSYRVIPIVGSMGQAAGIAAALCSKLNVEPRNLEAEKVRAHLIQPQHKVTLEL
ncbi:MAG TPA: FAD-dependent oxidoreductase, partial [bacterium]|nr:FAD-dependent oxidoreductase [bacterium]